MSWKRFRTLQKCRDCDNCQVRWRQYFRPCFHLLLLTQIKWGINILKTALAFYYAIQDGTAESIPRKQCHRFSIVFPRSATQPEEADEVDASELMKKTLLGARHSRLFSVFIHHASQRAYVGTLSLSRCETNSILMSLFCSIIYIE